MQLLLDTHTFLWFITADSRLSGNAENAIRNRPHTVLFRVASIWEIAIKVSIGRLPLPRPLDAFMANQLSLNQVQVLSIEPSHAMAVSELPMHHRDPFDRLLIAQSLVEGIPLVSADSAFDPYGVQRVW